MDLNNNQKVEICDFACKDSNILMSVFNRLCERFLNAGIDKQQIADSIYGICLNGPTQIEVKTRLENRTGCEFKHIICVPGFLNWIRDNKNTTEIPEKLKNMKFDYIVMNPPYNDVNGGKDLHYKFLCKALQVAETVVSIQPAPFVFNKKCQKNLPLNGRGGTISIIDKQTKLFQGASLPTALAVSCFARKYKDIKIEFAGGTSSVYKSMTDISITDQYQQIKPIIEKGYQKTDDRLGQHVCGRLPRVGVRHIIKDPSVLKGKWITQLTHIIPENETQQNRYGVMTYGENSGPYQSDGSRIPMCFCMFDTEQEAHNCWSYLASDFVRAYAIAFKTGKAAETLFRHIPWPGDFNTDPAMWTNDAISDWAGLDQEERQWLAEMLPNCYHVR